MNTIKIQNDSSHISMPTRFIRDERLSLMAKGLLCYLYLGKKISSSEVQEMNKVTEDEFEAAFNELVVNGYITQKGNTITILKKPKTKPDGGIGAVFAKELNLYQKCMNEVDNFTEDIKLRLLLKEYLELRLNPGNTRLKDYHLRGVGDWKRLLDILKDNFPDAEDMIKNSIEMKYATFIPSKHLDDIFSMPFTDNEIKILESKEDEKV